MDRFTVSEKGFLGWLWDCNCDYCVGYRVNKKTVLAYVSEADLISQHMLVYLIRQAVALGQRAGSVRVQMPVLQDFESL